MAALMTGSKPTGVRVYLMYFRFSNYIKVISRSLDNFGYGPLLLTKNFKLPLCLLNSRTIGIRTLVSAAVLGLDGFHHRRKKYEHHFQDKDETFKKKMYEVIGDDKLSVYHDDLKSMVYLCNSTDEDLMLLNSLLRKYLTRKQDQLTEFQFGPEVMRLYYVTEKPEEALKVIRDEELRDMFAQVTSYTVLMDSLFHYGYYQEIITLLYDLLDRKLTIIPVPKEPAYVALAACYKLNTPESLQETFNILNKAQSLNVKFSAMHFCFAAALALQQGQPVVALEFLCRTTVSSVIYSNLKAMCLAKRGQPDGAVALVNDMREQRRYTPYPPVLSETMEMIDGSVKKTGSKGLTEKFEQLRQEVENGKFINYASLDSILCEPLGDGKPVNAGNSSSFANRIAERYTRRERLAASFSQNKRKYIR